MAKKKKRYGYKDGDENARFAPGGSAASEWEEEQRQSFTMGRTINPSDTSKRFNTEQDIENYKPIKTETYQSYMASKLAQAKANNPKSRVHITANDLSSYSNARAKLFNIDPTAELKSQSEFTSQYKSSVDKKARLNDMVQLAQGLDLGNAQDLVRKSYNDLNAVEGLANTRTNAEGLLKRVEEYRKLYGDSKELKVLEDRAKGIADYINTNAKGGSAVSQAVFDEANAPVVKSMYDTKTQTRDKIKAKNKAISDANIEEKYGRPGDLGYEGVKNIKAETPAEADWKEEKQLQLDPFKKYEDNKKEIESLKNDKMPLGNQNGVGYQDEQEAKDNRINALREQNAQILSQYAEDIIAKANLTDDERRKLENRRGFDLSDNEYRWDVGDKAANEVTLNRKEMIDTLTKRGISEEEASLLLDYEGELEKQTDLQTAYKEGQLRRRTNGEFANLTEDIARTVGSPLISPLEKATGTSGEYSHAEKLGRQAEKSRYYEGDGLSEGIYDFAEMVGTIAGASLYGGSIGGLVSKGAIPFVTKATEDSYYNALDKGADESQASEYASITGLATGLIYGIGLPAFGKITSKAFKGSMVEGLAKEIVEGKPTSSLGKAIVKNIGTNAAKEGLTFAGLTTTTQVADILAQAKALGEKSDLNQMVEAYKQQGLSDDEAWQNTVLDISKQIGQGALESFASGAILGAGGAVVGNVRQAFNGGDRLPENTLLRSEEGTPLRDSQGREILDDNGQPIRVQQGLNIDSEGRVLNRNISEEVRVTQSENGVPIIDSNGNQVTVNGQPIRAERTTLSGVETYNKLRNEYENARVGLNNIQERIEGLWDDYKQQGFSNPEEVADFEKVRAKFNKDYVHVVNKAKAILGEYAPISARDQQDLLEGRKKLEDFREDLETVNPSSEEVKAEVDELKAEVDTQIDNIDTVVDEVATADFNEPTEIVEPTYTEPSEITEPVETPTKKAENVDLSNLNDRQSEIAEIGAKYNLPEDTIKSMVANDNAQISPRLYANEYSKMYLLGKQETIDSIEDAIRRNPEVRDTIQKIGTQAAGSAFSEGNTPRIETILRPETKPKGRLAVDFQETLEEAKVHEVLRRYAKASGIDIAVTNDMGKYTNQGKAQGIAFLNNGKIVLSRDVANILGTADHEILGHFGKALAPKAYKELASIIVDTYQKDLGIRGYDKFIQNLKAEAKEQGIYLTESDAQEEAIAYGLETMAMNTDAMEKFIDRLQDSTMTEAEKKTILDKLKEFVKHVIETLKQRLKDARVRTGTESMLKADIDAEKVAEAKLKVYEEIRSNLESMTETETDTQSELKEKGKFSLSEPVEETKDLVAVHNLHEDDLENSLDLGGFAMPSIAVIKAENGHNNYGAISVVFYKDTIDPANKQNKVYSGDAWTPTFPETNYKLDEKVREQLSDKIADLVGKQAFSELRNTLDYDNMQDTINRQGGDYINAYKREPIMKLAYLRDTGKKFDIPMENKHYGKKVDLLERVLEYAKNKNYDIKDLWNSEYETYENDGIIDDLRDLANKYKQDNIVKELRDKGKDKDTLQKAAKHKFYTTENFGFAQAETMLHSAYRLNEDLKNGGIPQVIDTYATSDKLDEIVDNDDKKYNEWLEKTFNGIIEKKGIRNSTELFTPSGYRRDWEQLYDSVTLDNIVKAMRRDIPKGAGFLGAGQPTAAATYEFKNIDDIRSRKDQLKILPEEEYNKIHENLIDRFSKLVDRYNIKKDDEFGSRIDAGHVLSENIAKSRTLDQLKQNLEKDSQYGYYYSENFAEDVWDLVEDMQDTPTGYFEAKPQRAVRLDEIAYTIVPDNVSQELLNALDENNIEYKTYEEGNEEQRKELLNDERVKFSLSEENEGKKLSDIQQQLSNDYNKAIKEYDKAAKEDDNITFFETRRQLGKIVEEYAESKGYTDYVYHGTKDFGFTQVDLDKSDDSQTFWATDDFGTATTYVGEGIDSIKEIGKKPRQVSKLTPQKKIQLCKEAFEIENDDIKYVSNKEEIKELANKTLTNIEREIRQKKPTDIRLTRKYDEVRELFNSVRDNKYSNDIDTTISALKTNIDNYNYLTFKYNIEDSIDRSKLNTLSDILSAIRNNENIYVRNNSGVITENAMNSDIIQYSHYGEGVYQFYANTDNFMVLDAEGENWNNIRYKTIEKPTIEKIQNYLCDIYGIDQDNISYDKKTKTFNYDIFMPDAEDFEEDSISLKEAEELFKERKDVLTTREIAQNAMNNDYDGVLIKNVTDNGGRGAYSYQVNPASVYIFFNPVEQVKSADPITYDDNGNVIPLEERFSKDHDDIRYSMANEGRPLSEIDSEGNELSKEQQDYFKDSKVRDEEGNLLVMYHGTPQGNFTIFNKGMNYFTPFKEYAEEYKNPGASAVNTRKQTTVPKVYEVYLNITKPFDIRIPEVKDIFIDEYVKGGYAQGINPYEEYKDTTNSGALDWVEVDNVYEWLEETGRLNEYDGIIADEGGVLSESGEVNYSGLSYITFNSNQAKNIDNKQPTTNEDIRLSLKEEVTDRDIERFKAIKEDLGNVLRITKGSKLDTQDTRKMALQLRKNWNVKYNTELMTDELKTIGRLIETKGIQNTDTTDYIKAFVTDVLKSETVVDDNTKAFNSYVRNHKIYLSPRDREQITDYNEFRKSAMGSMRLTTSKEGALSVDEFYEHIKDNYPEYYSTIFDEQYPDSSNLPDLLEWIKTAREGTNLLDMYGDEALDFYTQDVIGAYTNAKVEDITNSKAKRNKLLKDVGEMVDTIEGLNKTKDTANQNLLDQMRKLQSDINQRLDRQRENIVNQYEEKMKDIEAKLENEKNENVKRIKQIKEKQKIRERKQADSRKRTQQRQVIRRTRDRLKTTINKPTIHKYIPIPLQNGVKDLFNSIDLGEQFTTARLNKMRDNAMIRYTGERLEQELAKIDEKEQAFNNNLKSFRDTLDKYIKGQLEYANGEKMKPQGDADTYYKPILNMIDNTIEKIGSTSLMKMDLSQLKEVSKTLRAIEKATTERRRPQTIQLKDESGKVLDDYEKISRLAMNQTKKLSKLTNSLLSYQMTGHNTMLAMGGFNPNSIMGQLADDIDQAYIVESKIKQDLNSIWDKVLNIKEGRTNLTMKSEVAQRYNKDDLVDVGFKDIEGKPILLNHDSLIWEYLNLESDDNLTHAARGGISFPDYKKLYGRKSNTQVYSDATRRTFNVDAELKEIQQQINDAYELEDYDKVAELAKNQANILEGRKNELRQIRRNIYKQLTDYDKKVIKAWKQIRDISTDMLNKYWLKTYGFENFNEEAYWRIVTNPNFIKGSDSGNLQQVITNLSESGSTIARLEGAGNPIISGSALFAVDEYINNTAKLIAYSGLQRDLNAVMRYTIDGYNNLQQKVQENAPKLAENFVTFQQALFGGGLHKEGSRFIATTRGLAARATLSPNLRVALAQVPSFLGTYRYTDAKAIKNAWLPRNRVKQSVIDKYTPLMYARGASGYSLETSDLRQDTNKFLRTLNKTDRAVGGWLYQIPNKMDSWTVRHTFGAYLDYARRNYNLEEGTKEQIENGESPLYKKAAELFNEGTLRTQPMFNAFNKNVLQLDDSELKKTLTIFHTQPFQYFNLALQDIMEYKYEVETNGKDSAKAKKARRRALKGIAAILGGTALFTLIKIGVDKTIRHKKDDLDPEDVAEQLISSMANMFVLGSTLVDSIYALITKKKQIFDFEIYGTQIINSLIDFAKATSNVIDGKDVNYAYHITNILSNLGIPVANIEKDLGGIYRNIEDYMDNGMRDYSNEMNDKELLQEYILGNKSKDDLKDLGVEINDKTKFSNAVKKLYSDGEIDKDTAIKVMNDSGLYNDPKRKQSSSSYIEGKLEWWDIYNKYHDDYINGDSNEKASIRSKIALLPISNYYYHSKTNPHKRIVEYIKDNWKKTE